MTNFKKWTAIGATMAFVAIGCFAVAHADDLDDLLSDLEGDSATTETVAETKEEAKTEATEEVVTEEETTEEAAESEEEATEEETTEEAAESETEEKAEEPAAAAAEEAKPEETTEAKVEETAEESEEETAEEETTEETAETATEEETEEPAAAATEESKPEAKADPDAELIANINETELVRRRAFDEQAKRVIREARKAMSDEAYTEAARQYSLAMKLLNDRPASSKLRRECEQGVAEGLYRAAIQEDRIGRRDRAIKLMDKAKDMRHPKARKQLEIWNSEIDPNAEKLDDAAISHRRNDKDFQGNRDKYRQYLRRARQLLSVRELDDALEQCEIVIASDPYNQEAIRLRKQIVRKMNTVVQQEKEVSRDSMIEEVGKKWRPVYAPNARKIGEMESTTVKKTTAKDDPERTAEQNVIKRMKEMRLPTISFKPPATIIDAVEFFRGASKDFDRPEIPLEQRGFNFVLKTPEALKSASAPQVDESDDFSDTADDAAAENGQAGVPVIPMITASDISFYDALKLVCESVEYKFKVQGSIVMVMHKDMSTDEMVTRSYPVLASFLERMGGATSDIKEMKQAGFGGGNSKKNDDAEENQEKDWKQFFELMGVKWPEGSSILYIKTIGKLRVKNTYENLAELEKALTELNVDQKLIEIEARFVEVCQEDLNSLGFEWILNSDYSIGMNNWLGKAMGLKQGAFVDGSQTSGHWEYETSKSGYRQRVWKEASNVVDPSQPTSGATWSRASNYVNANSPTYDEFGNVTTGYKSLDTGDRNVGINAFGGNSEYTTGQRYLSTVGNHISGESASVNDQFVRVNAFLGNADLSMILHMLSQRSDTDLLSAPKVLTRPGEEAIIKVVTEYIYPTDYQVTISSSGSGSSGGSSSSSGSSMILAMVEPQSFTMREVGVILDVTPTLTDDGNLIDLKLNTQVVDEPTWKNYGMKVPFSGNTSMSSFEGIGEIFTGLGEVLSTIGSSLDSTVKEAFAARAVESASSAMDNLSQTTGGNIQYYDVPMEQPFFHVRSIDSSVSINPGSTIVMGGLITEERKAMDDKVPFLGDIPFIGRLFRSHSEWTNKRNLLIFVTTRLVDVRGREVTRGSQDEVQAETKAAPAPEAE